jgi:predicted Zn-dependent peptidase
MAAAGYPKAAVFTTSEQYGLEIGCTGGIEYSMCALGSINDYWSKALPLFAALITKPLITAEDTQLTKDRLIASLIDIPSDPGTYVNEIVNQIFYPAGHPYRLNHDEALKELQHLGRNDLLAYQKSAVNAASMGIVVVTSMPAAKVVADLNKAFGNIQKEPRTSVSALAPVYDASHAYKFEDRALPTAYIRIKLNAPSVHDKDSVAMRLVYEMLSEELGEEIRTKRSLSYAVHAYVIEYSLGIGVISASTSKPKETLAAIGDVLRSFRAKTYSDEELEEYKHGFATSYYLSQETHSSLASTLANAWYFYGDANRYYDLPRLLDKVTPADVKRLANSWLNDLRVGAIYGRNDFKDEWALDLIKQNRKGAPAESAPALEAKPEVSGAED